MRASPSLRQQADNLQSVRRSRQALIVGVIAVAVFAVAAAVAGTSLPPPGDPDLQQGAFARIVGASGSASGVVYSDNSLITDGGTFVVARETVSVRFDSGNEARGIIASIAWAPDSLPVAFVTLIDGGITPGSLALGTSEGNEGEKVIVACAAEDGTLRWTRVTQPDASGALPGPAQECGPGAAFLANAEGHDLLALVVKGRSGSLRLVPIERVPLP